MAKTLKRNTIGSDGKLYGPDGETNVPKDIAEEFTNPNLYVERGDTAPAVEDEAVDPSKLKGDELDEALAKAELSTDGTLAEKRARLAEHQQAG